MHAKVVGDIGSQQAEQVEQTEQAKQAEQAEQVEQVERVRQLMRDALKAYMRISEPYKKYRAREINDPHRLSKAPSSVEGLADFLNGELLEATRILQGRKRALRAKITIAAEGRAFVDALEALQTMRSALVHGINDERGSHDCLYVMFSTRDSFTDEERSALSMILPYIDTALRQVAHLPHQTHDEAGAVERKIDAPLLIEHDLTDREVEILEWVAMGKTNPEIGSILNISAFTVKNHVQRIFKKLNVTNRAQAVSKIKGMTSDV